MTTDERALPALPLALPDGLDSWKVYLLECVDGTYYCGVAKDVDRRLAQHNGQRPGGAKYTRPRRPVKLLAFRICADKKSAYRLEYAVKSAPRGKKLEVLLAHLLM
jgi:Predicted endonuclease containing a URI domain